MIVLDNLRFDVGRGVGVRQFPTAEVNGEMHDPHGCDWFSIREADKTERGWNPTSSLFRSR